jgi:hypothetical protein
VEALRGNGNVAAKNQLGDVFQGELAEFRMALFNSQGFAGLADAGLLAIAASPYPT